MIKMKEEKYRCPLCHNELKKLIWAHDGVLEFVHCCEHCGHFFQEYELQKTIDDYLKRR